MRARQVALVAVLVAVLLANVPAPAAARQSLQLAQQTHQAANSAAPGSASVEASAKHCLTLAQFLRSAPPLQPFLQALEKAGLLEVLDNPRQKVTVLAPLAWPAQENLSPEELLQWAAHHIVPKEMEIEDFGPGGLTTTLANKILTWQTAADTNPQDMEDKPALEDTALPWLPQPAQGEPVAPTLAKLLEKAGKSWRKHAPLYQRELFFHDADGGPAAYKVGADLEPCEATVHVLTNYLTPPEDGEMPSLEAVIERLQGAVEDEDEDEDEDEHEHEQNKKHGPLHKQHHEEEHGHEEKHKGKKHKHCIKHLLKHKLHHLKKHLLHAFHRVMEFLGFPPPPPPPHKDSAHHEEEEVHLKSHQAEKGRHHGDCDKNKTDHKHGHGHWHHHDEEHHGEHHGHDKDGHHKEHHDWWHHHEHGKEGRHEEHHKEHHDWWHHHEHGKEHRKEHRGEHRDWHRGHKEKEVKHNADEQVAELSLPWATEVGTAEAAARAAFTHVMPSTAASHTTEEQWATHGARAVAVAADAAVEAHAETFVGEAEVPVAEPMAPAVEEIDEPFLFTPPPTPPHPWVDALRRWLGFPPPPPPPDMGFTPEWRLNDDMPLVHAPALPAFPQPPPPHPWLATLRRWLGLPPPPPPPEWGEEGGDFEPGFAGSFEGNVDEAVAWREVPGAPQRILPGRTYEAAVVDERAVDSGAVAVDEVNSNAGKATLERPQLEAVWLGHAAAAAAEQPHLIIA